MQRKFQRPTLDGMDQNQPATAAFIGNNAPGASVTALVGPGGAVQLVDPNAPDRDTPTEAGHNKSRPAPPPLMGGGANSMTQSSMNVDGSYKVSDSGALLTLGNQYHVSSSGVWEFKSNCPNMNIASASDDGVTCNHISELDFENGRQIGRGASGKVFTVLHRTTGKHVCVKQMLIDDNHHREEVKRELDSLHKAASPWIVDFYGAFFHNDLGVILLVLQLMDGSIHSLLQHHRRLTEMQTKAFCFQVLHGLNVLHNERFLIHRDIKPGNLLFSKEDGRVKITDFGVSRGQRSQDPQSVHTFVGSILYMSPERLEGKSYSYECDVWSLGIVLCEAVTGYHPFQESFGANAAPLTFWDLLQKVMARQRDTTNQSPLNASLTRMRNCGEGLDISVSPEMDSFVADCLAFDRDHRSSAEQLLMHPWLEGMTVEDSMAIVKSMTVGVDRDLRHSTTVLPRGASAAASPAQSMQQSQSQPSAQQRSAALLDDFMASAKR